jgi:hypothetical protein
LYLLVQSCDQSGGDDTEDRQELSRLKGDIMDSDMKVMYISGYVLNPRKGFIGRVVDSVFGVRRVKSSSPYIGFVATDGNEVFTGSDGIEWTCRV